MRNFLIFLPPRSAYSLPGPDCGTPSNSVTNATDDKVGGSPVGNSSPFKDTPASSVAGGAGDASKSSTTTAFPTIPTSSSSTCTTGNSNDDNNNVNSCEIVTNNNVNNSHSDAKKSNQSTPSSAVTSATSSSATNSRYFVVFFFLDYLMELKPQMRIWKLRSTNVEGNFWKMLWENWSWKRCFSKSTVWKGKLSIMS